MKEEKMEKKKIESVSYHRLSVDGKTLSLNVRDQI